MPRFCMVSVLSYLHTSSLTFYACVNRFQTEFDINRVDILASLKFYRIKMKNMLLNTHTAAAAAADCNEYKLETITSVKNLFSIIYWNFIKCLSLFVSSTRIHTSKNSTREIKPNQTDIGRKVKVKTSIQRLSNIPTNNNATLNKRDSSSSSSLSNYFDSSVNSNSWINQLESSKYHPYDITFSKSHFPFNGRNKIANHGKKHNKDKNVFMISFSFYLQGMPRIKIGILVIVIR